MLGTEGLNTTPQKADLSLLGHDKADPSFRLTFEQLLSADDKCLPTALVNNTKPALGARGAGKDFGTSEQGY